MSIPGGCDCSRSLILVITLFLEFSYSWRSYNMEIVDYRYEVWDRSLIPQACFELILYKQHRAINGSFTFSKNVTSILMSLKIQVPRPNAEEMNMIDTTVNVCQALEQTNNNLVRIILGHFNSTTGYFPKKCPVEANREILVEHFYIDADMFPPYMPDLFFRSQLHLLVHGKYIFKAFVNGTVVSKRGKPLNVR